MSDYDVQTFGDLVRHARLAAGLTQEMLAERAGLSVRGISDLERGLVRAPRRDTLALLAEALVLSDDERQRWDELRQSRSVQGPASSASTGRVAPAEGRLPRALTNFIGRESERAAVVRLLQRPEVRLLTLTGPGGVGKTRLALAVGEELSEAFRNGIHFAALAPVSDPRAVVSRIAAALGVADQAGISLLDGITNRIGERELLLVLDNFEHVLPAAPDVAALLAACPYMTIMITSRSPLHLSGEQEYPVPPMDVPDTTLNSSPQQIAGKEAVSLFIQRAQAIQPSFALTGENTGVVVEICRKLDGLPLAIELAVARLRVFSPVELLSRLDDPLGVLGSGPRDAPARQQTLRHAIAWSYELLSQDEQELFRALSVCRGGCTLKAVEAIASPKCDVLAGLSALIEHNLVKQHESPDGALRFNMLETIREYGMEQLAASNEADKIRRRHAMHFLPWAERWGREVSSGESTLAILLLESDVDNVRAAFNRVLSHDEPDRLLLDATLRTMGWKWAFWRACGRVAEGRRWLASALAIPGASDIARALALNGAGALAAEQGDFDQAIRQHEESLAIAVDEQDGQQQIIALWGISRAAAWNGDVEHASQAYEEGIALSKQSGNRRALANLLGNYGSMLAFDGDALRARQMLEDAVTVYRDAYGSESSIIAMDLAYVMILHGDLEQAREMLASSLELERERGPSRIIADCLEKFAYLAVLEKRPALAARLLGVAESLRQVASGPQSPAQRRAHDDFVARGMAQLSEPTWNDARAEGQAMSLEEGIDYALDLKQTGGDSGRPEGGLSRR